MNKQIDQFDNDALAESIAIAKAYKPHTMDFGGRLRKTHIVPCDLLHIKSRKRCRYRNPRQIDLIKQRLKELGKRLKENKYNVGKIQL